MVKKMLALILAAAVLAGCNTMSGLGKDIERGGEMLQDAAKGGKK